MGKKRSRSTSEIGGNQPSEPARAEITSKKKKKGIFLAGRWLHSHGGEFNLVVKKRKKGEKIQGIYRKIPGKKKKGDLKGILSETPLK